MNIGIKVFYISYKHILAVSVQPLRKFLNSFTFKGVELGWLLPTFLGESCLKVCFDWIVPQLLSQDTRVANPALGVGQEERFFNKLEDDVSRIVQREKRREQFTGSQGQEVSTSTEHEPVSPQAGSPAPFIIKTSFMSMSFY